MKLQILWDPDIKYKNGAYAPLIIILQINQNNVDAQLLANAVYICYINAPTTSRYIIMIYFARSTYSNVSVLTTIFSPCSINTGT